jgi:hypothetical protein
VYGLKTGGRKKGSRNRMTMARETAISNVVEAALIENGFAGDAHAFLMGVYKDPEQPLVMRIDAAKAAIGYEKPKLTSLDANIDANIGTYEATPIPVESRDSDAVASSAGPAADSDPARPG